MNFVTTRAGFARGADFFLHILFGDGFNLVIGFRSVVDGAEGGVAFGRQCFIVAVRVVMIVMVIMVMCQSGFYHLLGHGFDHGVNNLAFFGGCVFRKIDHIHAAIAGDGGRAFHLIAVFDAGGLRPLALCRAARAAIILVILGTGKGALFFQQRFAVSDRDLVVIGVNFGKGQKAVPIAAVINKGRLQRGFNPRHFGQIDVSGKLALV